MEMSHKVPNNGEWSRAVRTAVGSERRRWQDQAAAPTCDSAFFPELSAGSPKVVGQKADKELKRLRCVFAPQQDRKQVKGGVGYLTVGIIEPRFSPGAGLFMEETCENRARTHDR
ncbi:MAG: hypothetical protein ACYTAO_20960 [Planctomycetota bacterium]